METKRTAEQARRIALERAALATQVPPATIPVQQQSLPQGSTWGSVASKGWKPVVPVVATTPSPGKKSMAQIQKEEEEERARLAKTKEVVPGLGAGVRGYAGAAAAASTAKPAMPTAWTMVGPGGRPQPGRPIHSGGINPNTPGLPPTSTITAATITIPAVRASPARTSSHDVKPQLQSQPIKSIAIQPPVSGVEDFQKWCRSQLKSLSGVNYDEIYQMMVSLPPNESTTSEIISDTIYAHSSTLDGRHFAEEFLKRRKQLGSALDPSPPTSTSPAAKENSAGGGAGGWNEVLKKEKGKDASGEWNSAFKVVAGKKGRRRG